MSKPVAYGGQAVIEGVMMRGPKHFAVACRRADGEIVIREEAVPAFFTRFAWARWPLMRGVFALADALVLGMKSLMFSADLAARDMLGGAGGGERSGRSGQDAETQRMAAEADQVLRGSKQVTGIAVPASAVFGMVMGITLFVLLPTLLVGLFKDYLPGLAPRSPIGLNLVEGLVRIAFLLTYIWAIGRLKEVGRVFQYHGAEHKAINALEQDGVADVDAAMRQSTIHPRCGTNFVLTVLILKILITSLFGWPVWWVRLLIRLAALPVVAALAFEVIRLAGRYRHVKLLQLIVLPGLLTQRLTTREPERDMVEVAVAALRSVLQREAPAPATLPEPAPLPAQV